MSKNKALYLSLINRDEWKEVFIFLVGMHNCLELQDEFLDFLMENNLKLYVECINAKSDLYRSKQNIEHRVLAQRYLEQIYKTYIFIVSTYFKSIDFDFEPRINKNHNPDLELIIVGSLSADAKHLSYGFFSQPGFTYYHIAVQEGDSIKSEIREATGEIQEEGIFEQMTMSYQRLGKQMNRGKIGSTIIQPYLDNQVLQKYVYRSIKESLEEVFGSFR